MELVTKWVWGANFCKGAQAHFQFLWRWERGKAAKVKNVTRLVLSCKFKVRFREMWSSAFIVGCQFKSLKTRQRRQRVQRVQLLVCGKVLQMSWRDCAASQPFVWCGTLRLPQPTTLFPTFNFRRPIRLSTFVRHRRLTVRKSNFQHSEGSLWLEVAILLCTSYFCKCLLLRQDQSYNFRAGGVYSTHLASMCYYRCPNMDRERGGQPAVILALLAVIRACRAFASPTSTPGRSVLIHPPGFANQGKCHTHTQYKELRTKEMSRFAIYILYRFTHRKMQHSVLNLNIYLGRNNASFIQPIF